VNANAENQKEKAEKARSHRPYAVMHPCKVGF